MCVRQLLNCQIGKRRVNVDATSRIDVETALFKRSLIFYGMFNFKYLK